MGASPQPSTPTGIADRSEVMDRELRAMALRVKAPRYRGDGVGPPCGEGDAPLLAEEPTCEAPAARERARVDSREYAGGSSASAKLPGCGWTRGGEENRIVV